MYRLFGRVPEGQRQLRLAVGQFVLTEGRKINEAVATGGSTAVTDKENRNNEEDATAENDGAAAGDKTAASTKSAPARWVDDVLALKRLMDNYLENAWNNDSTYEMGLQEVCS